MYIYMHTLRIQQQNQCYYDSKYKAASMTGIVSIKSGDESSLMAAVYSVGPISVRVDGRSNAFRVSDQCAVQTSSHAQLVYTMIAM